MQNTLFATAGYASASYEAYDAMGEAMDACNAAGNATQMAQSNLQSITSPETEAAFEQAINSSEEAQSAYRSASAAFMDAQKAADGAKALDEAGVSDYPMVAGVLTAITAVVGVLELCLDNFVK
jgi:hypothetical protein